MNNSLNNQTVSIPWGAWYKDSALQLSFPENCEIIKASINDAPTISEAEIKSAFKNPFGSAALRELARGKKNVAITVEDITRPAMLDIVLENVTSELLKTGIKNEDIVFVISNGAHAPMTREDIKYKLGESILSNYLVLNHNPYDNLVDTGVVLGKTPVKVNCHYMEADLKIAIGSIIPHPFAGFGSGGKLILPGLSDIATLERSHKFVMMGFRGGVNDVENNKFRLELENVVSQIGLDFYIGIVPNSTRETAGLFVGHFVKAHRKGVDFARKVFRTKVPLQNDVVILNAYPKDTELLQADTVFTFLKTMKSEILKEDGIIVVTSRCSNGLGYHGLFGPNMRLYKQPVKHRFLKDRDLLFLSPNINKAEFVSIFWDGYHFENSLDSLFSFLKNRFRNQFKALLLPLAPLQLLEH